ncbi:MAG TPA: hypothetical protein V6D23_06875 [Candidatus Obscuribacterales bacterium]
MSKLSETLLQICFLGECESLRQELRSLDAPTRRALYTEIKPALQALKQACRYSDRARTVSKESMLDGSITIYRSVQVPNLNTFWPGVCAHLSELDDYLERARICFFGSEDAAGFYLRLQMLQVGLSPRSQVPSGFKYARNRLPYFTAGSGERSWVYPLGMVLLERPEAWAPELLTTLCQRSGDFPTLWGYGRLLREVLELRPELAAKIAPFLGQAMLLDGFLEPDLEAYPATMIMAGLAYEPDNLASQGFRGLPVEFAGEALERRLQAADICRRDLVRLSLRRLLTAPKPAHANAWLRFIERMQLDAEVPAYSQEWLQLLFAPMAPALQKAVKELKPLIKSGDLDQDFETLLAAALQGLQHAAPSAAAAAWDLFKTLAARHPQRQQMLAALADALSMPHAKLRLQLLKWLEKQALPDSLLETLKSLQAAGGLGVLELDSLGRLLPHAPPAIAPVQPVAMSSPQGLAASRMAHLAALSRAKSLVQVPLQQPGWEAYGEDPLLEGLGDPQAVAAALNQGIQRGVTPIELERLIAGALAHPLPVQARADMRRRLDPVFRVIDSWEQPEANEELYQLPMRSLHLARLAYGWLYGGQRTEFHAASIPHRAVQLSMPLDYCLMQRVELALQALSEGRGSLLATPDFSSGWIRPETLARRLLQQLNSGLDHEDLGLALLRLPPASERGAIWQQLAGPLKSLGHPLQRAALEIALGPDQGLDQALKAFSEAISRNPPDDWILQIRFYTAQPRDTEPNRLFRLLNRAVLARTGLDDALAGMPQLRAFRLDQLLINGGVDHSHWSQVASHFMEEIKGFLTGSQPGEALPAELSLPEPRQKMLRLGKLPNRELLLRAFWHPEAHLPHPFEADPALRHMLEPHALPYPQMAAHVVEWLGLMYQPGYGFGFSPAELVQPLGWHMPLLAQKLWEAAIVSLKQLTRETRLDKHLFAPALLSFGERPYVRIEGASLASLAPLLTSKHLGHRAAVLRLLEALLADGRVGVPDLVDFWADRLAGPGEGFKFLLEAADEWQAQAPACELVLLAALERLWSDGRSPASRNMSRLLELYLQLCARHGLAPEQPQARAALQELAQSGSKGRGAGALPSKARLLLQQPAQHQLEAALLQALAAYVGKQPVIHK